MEQKLYETLGRKQAQLEAQDEAYTALLGLLADVVAGKTARSRVLVNLTDRTWLVAREGESPAMPANMNGPPDCVAAA